MNEVICIYTEDITTGFLRPLCNFICSTFNATEVGFNTSDDDDPHELIYDAIKNAQTIFFLGHGRSDCLYASIIDNDKLIDESNISLLEGKQLFLLACNSNQFIRNFHLSNAIGFGFLPTSMDDIERARRLHRIDISFMTKKDISFFNCALVRCLINTLSIETMNDLYLFSERMKFSISKEIVDCLMSKDTPYFATIADELFYVYKDMLMC